MRTIGLFAMCVLLAACATTPMFPPEIMKDVEKDTPLILRPGRSRRISLPASISFLTKWNWEGKS